MIETLKPRGAIVESLVKGIKVVRGNYCCIDEYGNLIVIPQADYENLKEKGIKDYDNCIEEVSHRKLSKY